MDDFDRSGLIIKCETREELMEKLKEKNETFEETFKNAFEQSYARGKIVQKDIINKFLDLEKDIQIINTLNDNQLKNFMKAFSEIVNYSTGRLSNEEVILNWVKLICQIDMNTFNRLFQSNDIINAYESIPNVLLVLEKLIPIMPEERFKILCPLYRRTEYSCSWLDIMKEKFPEKYKKYSNFLVDECIKSINSEIDYNIFKESWIDLVLERLRKEDNMDGLIKLFAYKVNHFDDKKRDIPLNNEQIKLILDTLTDKKIDLFGELTRLIYYWSPTEISMIDAYSRFIVKIDGNLLDSYTALLDNATFSEYGFKKFIGDLKFYYDDKMYYLHKQETGGVKYLAEGVSKEKLDKIRQFVTKLEKRYIKFFSESIKTQNEYFEERSSMVHVYLLDIEKSICDLVNQEVSNEEIDELVDLTPIPALLRSFR